MMNTVMVVDDASADRERLAGILRDAGCLVSVASTGEEALKKAKAEKPSIIFMDIVMPDMDGYATCRKLAADPDTKAIPIVFVSTKNQRADQVWARMQGGKELITKPYSETQVTDALKYAA
jgi:twitching motility two-component system response regulator PilH